MKLPDSRLWVIFTLVSLMSAIIVYWVMAYLGPHVRTITVQADAVAVANTYIVLTTLIVTGFAAIVALTSFYLTQNTNQMKMLELEEKFQAHLDTNDLFAQKLKGIYEAKIRQLLSELQSSDEFKVVTGKLLEAAKDQMRQAAEANKAMADVLSNAISSTEKG